MTDQALLKSDSIKFTTQNEAKEEMNSKMGMKAKLDVKKWVKTDKNHFWTKKWRFKTQKGE